MQVWRNHGDALQELEARGRGALVFRRGPASTSRARWGPRRDLQEPSFPEAKAQGAGEGDGEGQGYLVHGLVEGSSKIDPFGEVRGEKLQSF